jgi:DNA-binding transcriptional MerR regulator
MSLTPPTQDTPLELSVGELAERGGVSRRTVRFYVQRGLLPPPHGGGRGSFYDAEHLARLVAIRQLQEDGLPLEQVQARLASGPPPLPAEPAPAPAAETWRRHALGPGVELLVRDGALPADLLAALLHTSQALLGLAPSQAPTQTAETDRTRETEGSDRAEGTGQSDSADDPAPRD